MTFPTATAFGCCIADSVPVPLLLWEANEVVVVRLFHDDVTTALLVVVVGVCGSIGEKDAAAIVVDVKLKSNNASHGSITITTTGHNERGGGGGCRLN
jgi:hypothetical protein